VLILCQPASFSQYVFHQHIDAMKSIELYLHGGGDGVQGHSVDSD